ncbi:type II secretion system F family protein [Vibrio kasasachensis]|uniref:type II secretion system F family protein n=1 Tax=Vibrio kasasachensis TaxID=2910248 RepID=UPI003D12639A
MEELLDWVNSISINQETLIMALVLVTTILVVLTVGSIIMGINSPLRRRLMQISGDNKEGVTNSNKMVDTLESFAAPIMTPRNEKERQTARHHLMHAGYHQNNALTLFYSLKFVTTILGLFVATLIYLTVPDSKHVYVYLCLAVGVGLFIPDYLLRRMVKKRQGQIRTGVPDMLDLLVVCTESGLGFNAALRRVADELVISHPELADELDTVCVKIQAGKTMPEALRELVVRTGIEELSGLVSMLSHASRIGGGLVQSLREYTEDYRDKRYQAAEEVAAKMPVKMMFPMVMCIWPCFFIVAIGPALISLMDAFAN